MSKSMLFLYVEPPLHAGTGWGLGIVDLPIQRERTTDYPIIQTTGIKGRLRAVEMPPHLRAAVELLASYSHFYGSGAHTTQGLGQTRCLGRC